MAGFTRRKGGILGLLLSLVFAVALVARPSTPTQAAHSENCSQQNPCFAQEIFAREDPPDPNSAVCTPDLTESRPRTQLPANTLAVVEILGVVALRPQLIDEGQWFVGSQLVCAFADGNTRFDNSPVRGSDVKVIGVRMPEGGPILAERITNRRPGQTFGVARAEVGVSYITWGTLASKGTVWRVTDAAGHDHFFNTGAAEIDAGLTVGTEISIEFLLTEPPPE